MQVIEFLQLFLPVTLAKRFIGIKWLKYDSLPTKADTEKQKKFFDAILEPLMKKAESGEISLLFMDASFCQIKKDSYDDCLKSE